MSPAAIVQRPGAAEVESSAAGRLPVLPLGDPRRRSDLAVGLGRVDQRAVVRAHNSVTLRPPGCLRWVRDPELLVDVRKVKLHRLLGDPEQVRELRSRSASGNEPQNVVLTRVRRGSSSAPWTIAPWGNTEEHRLAEGLPDGRREGVGFGRLQHAGGGASRERLLHVPVRAARGQDDDPQRAVVMTKVSYRTERGVRDGGRPVVGELCDQRSRRSLRAALLTD